MFIPGEWEIKYNYSAGPYATKFFKGLKEKRILGVKCPKCNKVIVPPRAFCDSCYEKVSEWIDVKDTGVLLGFTVVYERFEGLPEPPYAVGFIKLDGADTGLMHFIGGIDLKDPKKIAETLRVGIKVKAVWAEDRKANILDIKYFQVVK